jgi:serine phosphatase RsbU (regulator of sigma subunit)
MHTMTSEAKQPSAEAVQSGHAMACMEIWGGNERIDTSVSTPGLDVWVHSEPYGGSKGGGDIHYVSMCAAGTIARVALADVSGHGEEVSRIAVGLRGLMRKNINTLDQSRFARSLNEAFQMSGGGGQGHFATALLATYHAPSDHLLLVNAGHPRAMLCRASSRRWVAVDQSSATDDVTESRMIGGGGDESLPQDLPLGIIEPTAYSQIALPLRRGDMVLMVTDGVVEARDPSGRELGEAGLLSLLDSLNGTEPGDVISAVRDRLKAFTGGAAALDDVTLVLLHHNAQNPPKYSVGERLATLARWIGLSA